MSLYLGASVRVCLAKFVSGKLLYLAIWPWEAHPLCFPSNSMLFLQETKELKSPPYRRGYKER